MSALAVGSSMLIAAVGGWPFVVLIAVASVIATRWFGRKTLLHIPLAILAAFWVNSSLPDDLDPVIGEQYGWRLVVTSMPTMRAQGWSFDAQIRDGMGEGERVLVYSLDDHTVALGDEIYVTGALQIRDELKDRSYRTYLDGRGVGAQIYASRIEVDTRGDGTLAWLNRQRQEIVRRALKWAPGDAGSLIAGLVTGDDGKLAAQTDLEFTRSGLTHLTAVSGANLAFAVALFVDLGRFARRRKIELLIGGSALGWIYAVFVGLSPPTLRAALMTTAMAGGRLAGRPSDPLTLAAIMSVVQIAIRPADAFSISFQLSVVASMGLSAGLNRYPREVRRTIADWVRASIYAQLATFPVIAATFGQVSILAVVANIVAAPIALIAFPFSVVSLALLRINETLGAAFTVPTTWIINALIEVARIYGQSWAMISVRAIDPRLMIAGVLVMMMGLFALNGEAQYLRQKARQRANLAGTSR